MLELPLVNENQTNYSKYNQREINSIFISYCIFGELDKIKVMFNSNNISYIPNIHFENDEPFKRLIDAKNLDILDYLIFNLNMKKTSNIKKMLDEIDTEYGELIKNKFTLREVNENLNADLPSHEIKVKKNKV